MNKRHSGFTLVEIVVSLAILGIILVFSLEAVNAGIQNVIAAGNRTNESIFATSEIEKVILDPAYTGLHPKNLVKSDASIEIYDVLIPGELIYSKKTDFDSEILDYETIYTFFRVQSPYGTYTPGNAYITKSDPPNSTFQLGDIEVKPEDLKARYKHIGKGTLVVPGQSALQTKYTESIDWVFDDGIIIKPGVLLASSKDIRLTAKKIDLSEARIEADQSIVLQGQQQLIMRSTSIEAMSGLRFVSNSPNLIGTMSKPTDLVLPNTNLLTFNGLPIFVLDTHYNVYSRLNGVPFNPNPYYK